MFRVLFAVLVSMILIVNLDVIIVLSFVVFSKLPDSLITHAFLGEKNNCSDCSFSAPTYGDLQRHKTEKHKNIQVVHKKKNEAMKPSRQKLKGSGMLYGRKCRTREDIEILRARIGTHLQEELPNLSVEESVNVQEREEEFPTLHGPGLDPKVMKRLSEMAPDYVTETFLADNIDEPTSHRLRLLQRLRANGLMEMEVAADGNCQFRALSDQLYHSSENHDYVRKLILNQLKSHPELYEQYVDRDYGEYLEELSRSGSWGDNVTLHAAADVLGIKIIVVTSHPNVCYYQIDPNDGEPTRVVCLSFSDGGLHYNSVHHVGEDVEEDPPDQVPIQEDASDSKDICSKHTDEAASHRQRLSASLNENEDNVKVAPAPIVTAASWKSCCALFEVLFGFKAT